MSELELDIKQIINESCNRDDFCIYNIIIALKYCNHLIGTKEKELIIKLLPIRTNKIQEIMQRSIAIQNTTLWQCKRQNYITASSSGQCANLMGKASRFNCLLDKVTHGSLSICPENYWTDFGHRFEPVVKMIYCARNNRTIHNIGLVPHKKIGYLAASTDGITTVDNEIINIEINT